MYSALAFLCTLLSGVSALTGYEQPGVDDMLNKHFPPIDINCTQSLTDLLLLRQEFQLRESTEILREMHGLLRGSNSRSPQCPTHTERCPANFLKVANLCLFLGTTKMSWESARSHCQDLGGDLFTFKDANEFVAAFGLIKNSLEETERVWLGGLDVGIAKTNMRWITGGVMPSGTPFWGSYLGVPEPSGGSGKQCALFFGPNDFFLHDNRCDYENHFLCQYII